jgi:hypothetical protein
LSCEFSTSRSNFRRHSGMRRKAQATMRNCASENPYSRSWLWIPGSMLRIAPE